MKFQIKEKERVAEEVKEFLRRAPLENSGLTLDGTGINASYQYIILSMLGMDRILKLKNVNVISGSIFPYLFFLALKENQLTYTNERLEEWAQQWRRWHGVKPVTTVVKALYHWAVGQSPLNGNGNRLSFEATVTPEFSARTVNDLPANARFWLYCVSQKKLVSVHSRGPLSDMPLGLLVKCMTSVPRFFGTSTFQGEEYSDPIYSPLLNSLRSNLRAECRNLLISNMLFNRRSKSQILVKPHGYNNGRRLMYRDFLLFIAGLPIPELVDATRYGLFETQPLP